MEKNKILIVDDDEDVLFAAELFLKQHDFIVQTEKHPSKILVLLENENYDVILLDMNYTQGSSGGEEGFYWLNEILKADHHAVIILITAYGDIEMAVRAIRQGATDFITKPWQNEKFLTTINFGLKLRKSYKQTEMLKHQQKILSSDLNQHFKEIISRSPAMVKNFTKITKVSKTDVSVLILGENGTGKELVARALHNSSNRAQSIFLSLDMGAISENLFESELFGHVKGAFTDAKENQVGRIEAASGGTLFLDEIGNLSMHLQAKLLQVLENRTITPVGSSRSKSIDIRLICATNMPLSDMVARNEFRQDLLFRINTVEIHLPPLRERKEDIPVLFDHFINFYSNKYKLPVQKAGPELLDKLLKYHWPGNIRELKQMAERAVIFSESEMFDESEFFLSSSETKTGELDPDNLNLAYNEKMVIIKAIKKNNNNISNAAKELGITRTSLYRRLKMYGL